MARTRSEIAFTLNALAGKLAARPFTAMVRPFVEMMMTLIKHGTNGNGGTVLAGGERLRANSLPLTLIGLGLAWLVVSESGVAENLPAEEWLAGLRRRVVPTPGREGDGAAPPSGGNGETSAGGLVTVARATGERISEYAGVAGDRASRLGGDIVTTIERHPLLFGAIGLVSGAALATLLPLGRKARGDGGQSGRSTKG